MIEGAAACEGVALLKRKVLIRAPRRRPFVYTLHAYFRRRVAVLLKSKFPGYARVGYPYMRPLPPHQQGVTMYTTKTHRANATPTNDDNEPQQGERSVHGCEEERQEIQRRAARKDRPFRIARLHPAFVRGAGVARRHSSPASPTSKPEKPNCSMDAHRDVIGNRAIPKRPRL